MGTSAHGLDREGDALTAAQEAVTALRAKSALPSTCERAFTAFWKAYTGTGEKGLVYGPVETTNGTSDGAGRGHYFGYGVLAAAPLLGSAQEVCAQETGARGDLIVIILKKRENRKWRRQQKLQHAERIIGY